MRSDSPAAKPALSRPRGIGKRTRAAANVKSDKGEIEELPSPELFFGLVGAVGTDLNALQTVVAVSLNAIGYTHDFVRLSDLFSEFDPAWTSKTKHRDEQIWEYMDAGDRIREETNEKAVMAILAIEKIAEFRERHTTNKKKPVARHAYILRSLKTPEEVEILRRVYGGGFFLIAGYSKAEARESTLLKECADQRNVKPDETLKAQVRKLMERDEKDASKEFGQNVRDTFPLADLFVDLDQGREKTQREIDRFTALIHGDEFKTPTRDEHGMFHARAASLRSAELARQVGAAITSAGGELIALGANELPEAGGGLTWSKENDEDDYRDWKKGQDTNEKKKRETLAEVLEQLKKAGLLSDKAMKKSPEALLADSTQALKGSRFMNLTEFGRAVHAEMAAITDAARRGVSVDAHTLYTTTFPCHNCARHIIASGLRRVVYIEPYAKSLASAFHDEALVVDELRTDKKETQSGGAGADVDKKVKFEPFVGIAPRLFIPLFTMRKRKEEVTGKVLLTDLGKAVPRHGLAPSQMSYLEAETKSARNLKLALEKEGRSISQSLLSK